MHFNIHSLPIEAIDPHDTTFLITTKETVEDLRRSIQNLGLIQPPILFKENSKIVIVSGFRRIKACRQLGYEKIDVNLLDSITPKLQLVLLAVADNAMQRSLNLIEMSRAFNLLAHHVTDPTEIPPIVSALGLPGSADFIEKVKHLKHLEPDIQKGVVENSISLPTALELGQYKPHEGRVLSNLFRDLQLSLNKQREVLGFLTDIAGRDGESITRILQNQQIVSIMQSHDLDRHQKVQQLRKYLRRRRYPELSRMEEQYATMVKTLGLGPGFRLTPPRYFEGTDYTLSIVFRSQHELLQHLTKAQSKFIHPEFKNFLDR